MIVTLLLDAEQYARFMKSKWAHLIISNKVKDSMKEGYDYS